MAALEHLILPRPLSLDTEPQYLVSISTITDRLCIGTIDDALSADTLLEHNITAVVSILANRPAIPLLEGVPTNRQPCLHHMHLELRDREEEDLLRYLADAFSFIELGLADTAQDPSPGVILVHCRKGVSRSAALVAAYLMKKNDWDPKTAIEAVTVKRPNAWPEAKFGEQLRLWGEMKYSVWDGTGVVCGNAVPKPPYSSFRGGQKCCPSPECEVLEEGEEKEEELQWWEVTEVTEGDGLRET